MKRFVGVILVMVGLVVALAMTMSSANAKQEEAEAASDVQRIQREYLERVGWMRSNPDEASYKGEVNNFFRAYFKEVDDHLAKYGGNKDFDDYLNEETGGGEGKKDTKGAAAQRKARFDFEKRIFDQMRQGKYSPVWTATDKGLRLDVLTADVKMSGGHPVIRFETVLWGAQRGIHEDGKARKMLTSAQYNVEWKLADEKGKNIGKMEGSDPAMKLDYPERIISWFPPQMVLGYYELDLLPSNVSKVETDFTITSHAASGGEQRASFVWKLDTPAEWKLKPGEKWEGAQEVTASEDEIDPSAGKKK